MTVDTRVTPATAASPGAAAPARRETYRRELADLLERDPAALPDVARLVDDLALDSLAMMSLLAWLDGRGVTIDAERARPGRVGDVLALLEKATGPHLSVRLVDDADPRAPGAAEVTVGAAAPADPLVPVLSGRAFRLTPVEPADTAFLYGLVADPQTGFRWRYRGAPPPPDRFAADLWNHTLVQFVARRAADGRPVGHVMAYGPDRDMRHVYLGAAFHAPHTGTGLAAQVVAVFARYLFHVFPFHKIYMEVPGYNWPQLRSGEGRLFQVEARLRDHYFYAGRHWEHLVCAIYRS